jgi:RNA polymerase sigma-54 factor
MTITPRLELRQSQSLVMTPRLQQSLKMLRMSNLELSEHVAALVEANPLLEAAPLPEQPAPPAPSAGRAAAGEASAIDLAPAIVTLADHLRGQVRVARVEAPILAAALAVIDELEPDGYLRSDPEEIALRHGLSHAALDAGIMLVQECEPAGVGARGLAECLALQLRDRGLSSPPLETLLDHLDLLAAGKLGELAEICGVTPQAIPSMLTVLRGLDPRPGAGFAEESVAVAIPDVYVRRIQTGWEVELNTETLPRVLVNNVYAQRLNRGDRAAAYISECRAQASWLVRSLEQRARTILAVASAVVAHQEHFFAQGISGLRPFSQRTLAEKLGIHESTVSRVTAGKFLACDRGLFEMHFFFSQAIPTTAGGEAVSAASVQDRIRALIGGESPSRVLSDDYITSILEREGIDIARRTVAKYREGLGIPSSVARRRLKSSGARA